MFIRNSNSRGDTIVEVIICIAVIGLILSGAYSISTRSLNGVRVAQERGEALKVAEGQMEMIKRKFNTITSETDPALFEYATDVPTPPNPFPSATAFCQKASDTSVVRYTLPADDITKIDNYPGRADDCIVGRYHIAGQSQVVVNTQVEVILWINIFWERSGGGIEKLTMVYKATP